jgi:TusA-related sulfurtransferase
MSKKIDKILNLDGLQPPQSIFLIRKTLEKVEQGGTVEIVSREKEILQGIPRLFENTSYALVEIKQEHGLVHYTIIKK